MNEITGERDFYLFPSSNDEWMMLPRSEIADVNTGKLKEMIHKLKEESFCGEEIISENLYFYTKGMQIID